MDKRGRCHSRICAFEGWLASQIAGKQRTRADARQECVAARAADLGLLRHLPQALGTATTGPQSDRLALRGECAMPAHGRPLRMVADPLRELAVLFGLSEKMADDLLLIHCALHLEQDDDPSDAAHYARRVQSRTAQDTPIPRRSSNPGSKWPPQKPP